MLSSFRTAVLLLALLAATPGLAAALADLSGEWYFDVSSPNGPGRRDVLFRQEDHRVIGFIESDSASGRFVGSVDGANLEFTAVLEFGGQPMAAVYKAQVDGDSMSGTIDFGVYGRATFTGGHSRRRGRRPARCRSREPRPVSPASGPPLGISLAPCRRVSCCPRCWQFRPAVSSWAMPAPP